MFLFCVFSIFAMTFYAGSILVIRKFPNTVKISSKDARISIQTLQIDPENFIGSPYPTRAVDESKYTGGDILACFFGVMFGIFSLAFTLPNFNYIVEGTAAGFNAYKVIERVPKILRDDPGKRCASPETRFAADI